MVASTPMATITTVSMLPQGSAHILRMSLKLDRSQGQSRPGKEATRESGAWDLTEELESPKSETWPHGED